MRHSSREHRTMTARGKPNRLEALQLALALPLLFSPVLFRAGLARPQAIQLSTLDLTLMSSGWDSAIANRSVVGNELSLCGRKFASGIGTHAENRILAGDTLLLTPPMGWNDWYTHCDRVTDATMRQAADLMNSSGMADHGYQYVNIDDSWMNARANKDPRRNGPFRDANGLCFYPDDLSCAFRSQECPHRTHGNRRFLPGNSPTVPIPRLIPPVFLPALLLSPCVPSIECPINRCRIR
jgi:hypothetical protein